MSVTTATLTDEAAGSVVVADDDEESEPQPVATAANMIARTNAPIIFRIEAIDLSFPKPLCPNPLVVRDALRVRRCPGVPASRASVLIGQSSAPVEPLLHGRPELLGERRVALLDLPQVPL